MLIAELQETLKAIKNGTYKTITYKGGKKGYSKVTTMVVRLGCNYANLKSTKANGGVKGKPFKGVSIDKYLFTTEKGNTLLRVFTTLNSHQKAHSHYYDDKGNEISKADYYNGIGQKPSTETPSMLTINIDNIIAIK